MARTEITTDPLQNIEGPHYNVEGPHHNVEGPPASAADPAADVGLAHRRANMLISLAPLTPDALLLTLDHVQAAFPHEHVLVATPDLEAADYVRPEHQSSGRVTLVPYTPSVTSDTGWLPTAADYVNLYKVAREAGVATCLMLGAESQSLTPAALVSLSDGVRDGAADLATPHYALGAREGLVNSAMLFPVSHALFGARSRFPLAIDLAMSLRMAERLAGAGQRLTAQGDVEALVWPVSEAAVAGFAITEVEAGQRALPQPDSADLNAILAHIAGSLFGDVEGKASYWQRSRSTEPLGAPPAPNPDDAGHVPDVHPMLSSFRVAYTNLHEIWSLVLPPHTLLGLKKLSLLPAEEFRMQDALWVRIVYDFILAFRLRTLNRGHLLGALTPLYLAWVASHLLLTQAGVSPEQHIRELALAFEADKPYIVSRWRWPDRFNP